jgi:hypothetical protein
MIETMSRTQTGTEGPPPSEGKVAKTIEKQTAKVPSDIFLWAALSTMGMSLFLQMSGNRHKGLLLGQLTAPILILGLYNKLVKVAGSDIMDQGIA